MAPTDPLFWLIVTTSFLAAWMSSTFAFGGGFLMLAVIASVMPIAAVVPTHSALMLGMSLGRAIFFRRHVRWNIVTPFVLGCIIGAPLGAHIYLGLPEALIAAVIGVFILAATWIPPVDWRPPIPHPFFFVGVVHSFLSAMFSFGGLIQPLMMRVRLDKMQVIGTLAYSLLLMNFAKLGGYVAFGFDFRPWLPVICVSILAGIPGAWVGRHFALRISEEKFRLAFKLLMTGFALQLLYRGWLALPR